jgi:hypothetical protein
MTTTVQKGSLKWAALMKELQYSKLKSNKDVLCVKCWKTLNYEEGKTHKTEFKDHLQHILTSKHFTAELLFVNLAKKHGQVEEGPNGEELFVSPYIDKKQTRLEKRFSKKSDLWKSANH